MKKLELINIKDIDLIEECFNNVLEDVLGNESNDLKKILNNLIVKELLAILESYNEDIHKISRTLEIKILDMMNNLRKSMSKNDLNDEKIQSAKYLLNEETINLRKGLLVCFNELNKECKNIKIMVKEMVRNIAQILNMNKFNRKLLLVWQARLNKTLDQIVEMARNELDEVEITQLINALDDEIKLSETRYLKGNDIDNNDELDIDKYYEELELETVGILSKYKNIKEYKDLMKLAKQEGFLYERQAGSHTIYRNESNKIVVIPDKVGDAPIGTRISIIKRIFIQ